MDDMIRVLGVSGSLRKGSYNSAALRAAGELMPDGMALEIVTVADFPPYNEDVRQQGFPPPVERLRQQIADADALLIATPEYNYSIPGVLKNAIDWASRPPGQPFDGKPIAIMGASPGMLGTARAQFQLRQCFVFLNGLILNRPEVLIAAAHQKFDAEGRLTDEGTKNFLADMLLELRKWTLFLRRPGADEI